ncbi:MAG TPA: PAS domain-containing sensor histidine kinase [Segetibacter sp.]|jgi:PAS domain S-box-containing protein
MNYNNYSAIQNEDGLSDAVLNEVLTRSSQAIVLLNNEAVISYCSKHVTQITGYEPEEVVGISAFNFFQTIDIPASKQHHELLLQEKGHAASAVTQIKHKDGSMVWLDLSVNNFLHQPPINSVFVLFKKSTSKDQAEEVKLADAITHAKEEEKEFLASELHDNISQIIVVSKFYVDAAIKGNKKEELLDLCSQNLKLAIDEIRKLSYSLVSFDLQEFGINYAITSFISAMKTTGAINFNLDLEPGIESILETDKKLHIYRIIQEAINNVLKHAEATRVDILLKVKGDLIYLTIKDNGKGFKMNKVKPSVGLSSIKNRVKLLKGHFHITAPEQQGTNIEIHFPG